MQLAESALGFTRERMERGLEARALWLLGEIASRRDAPSIPDTEEHYRQALALAEDLGMRPLVAHCHLGLGALYRKLGRPEKARASSPARSLTVSVYGAKPEEEAVRSYAKLGVERVVFQLPSADRDAVLPMLDRYAVLMRAGGTG